MHWEGQGMHLIKECKSQIDEVCTIFRMVFSSLNSRNRSFDCVCSANQFSAFRLQLHPNILLGCKEQEDEVRGIVRNHEKGLNCQVNKRANRTIPVDASSLLPPISWPYVLTVLEIGKNHKVPFSHFINFALMHQLSHVVFKTGEAFNTSDASKTGYVLWKGFRLMHTD